MRLLIIFIFVLTLFSCTKKDKREIQLPSTKQEAMEVYKGALKSMEEGQFLIASEKFDKSESMGSRFLNSIQSDVSPYPS